MTGDPPIDSPTRKQTSAALRRRKRLLLRSGAWLSLRVDRRVALAFALAFLLAVLAVLLTLAVGQVRVPLREVLRAVVGGGNHLDHLIVHRFREPRVLTALFAGACLGMSGAIFQNLAGNPLVSPDIIGINAGARVAVAAVIVLANRPPNPGVVTLAGSLTAGAVVWGLSLGGGRSRYRLVLIGMGVNITLDAVIDYLLTQADYNQRTAIAAMAGNISAADWTTIRQLLIPAVLMLAVGTALGRQLELLQLGEPVAVGLGSSVRLARWSLLFVDAALAAIAVAAAGTTGFVAFVAPHIARGLARFTGNGVLPLSAAVGAALVVVADYAAQRAFEPNQLPVGILTALIGGPYFLYLLLRSAKAYTL